jgi:glucans biosynthesis protein C
MECKRLFCIDWLRVSAFGLLFVFHAVRPFDSYPWHIKNQEYSVAANYFVEFTHSWRMALIFLVSGAGTFFALRSWKNRFIRERVQRLVVPYIFGILVLVPPQRYLESLSHSLADGSLWMFLKGYPTTVFQSGIGISMIWTGHLGYHLWYLMFLFIQTIIFFPLLNALLLKLNIISTMKVRGSIVLILLFPLIMVDFLLRPVFPAYLDWADFAVYGVFFLYGFILPMNENVIALVEKYTFYFLATGVICWVAYVLNKRMFDELSIPGYTLSFLGSLVIKSTNSLAWVLAFLGLSKKYMNFSHSLLAGLNRGILPFYMLHQTIIVILGYNILQWELSIAGKFMTILTLSFMTTLILYYGLQRTKVLRVLFGMKDDKFATSFRAAKH